MDFQTVEGSRSRRPGFTLGSSKKLTWDFVAPSLHKFVTDVFVNDLIPAGFNHSYPTHLCLIPKVHNPESVGQLRPIILCNTTLKLIDHQNSCVAHASDLSLMRSHQPPPIELASFLPGRCGTDNVIIIQEIINRFNVQKGSTGHMIIKLDLEKPYDRLEWDFIRKVLHFFNFPSLYIDRQHYVRCVFIFPLYYSPQW